MLNNNSDFIFCWRARRSKVAGEGWAGVEWDKEDGVSVVEGSGRDVGSCG